jgi:hypothetical protein
MSKERQCATDYYAPGDLIVFVNAQARRAVFNVYVGTGRWIIYNPENGLHFVDNTGVKQDRSHVLDAVRQKRCIYVDHTGRDVVGDA